MPKPALRGFFDEFFLANLAIFTLSSVFINGTLILSEQQLPSVHLAGFGFAFSKPRGQTLGSTQDLTWRERA
jgi:hypothetical protein